MVVVKNAVDKDDQQNGSWHDSGMYENTIHLHGSETLLVSVLVAFLRFYTHWVSVYRGDSCVSLLTTGTVYYGHIRYPKTVANNLAISE